MEESVLAPVLADNNNNLDGIYYTVICYSCFTDSHLLYFNGAVQIMN